MSQRDENKGAAATGQAMTRGYFGNILQAARTTAEGMSITFAQMLRRPTTVQYPDRTPIPVTDSLPERYRGFLEVDMDICTACKACERDCPISCIVIDVEKRDEFRGMTRFDIDMGKCMYCGICVEACPTDAKAPGDEGQTKCIRMTREFEGVTSDFPALTFRFVRPGDFVMPYKAKKNEVVDTRRRGEIAREVRKKAAEYNPTAFRWALVNGGTQVKGGAADVVNDDVALARARELEPRVQAAGQDAGQVAELLFAEAFAQTDCEACGYPTCLEYAQAMLRPSGADRETWKCEPAGAASTRDVNLILELRAGRTPEEAAKAARIVTLSHHK